MKQLSRTLALIGLLTLALPVGLAAGVSEDKAKEKPFETRSFGPGGTETLIKTGDDSEMKLASATRTATSISITMKSIYQVTLYLEEAGARAALAPFKGQKLDEVLKSDDIHRAIINGDYPKAVVLRFSQEISSREIRENLNEKFLHSPAYGTAEAKRFVDFLKRDFKPGDEVVIRFLADRVLTTVANREQPEIRNQSFARALLAIWVGKDKKSGNRWGLLSEVEPLLQ